MNSGSNLMELRFTKPNFHNTYGGMKGYRKLVYEYTMHPEMYLVGI